MTNPEQQPPSNDKDKLKVYFRRHPLKRLAFLALRAKIALSPDTREPDERIGLLEDSIIDNPLYYPLEGSATVCKTALGGEWAGFDFWRPLRLPGRKDGHSHRRVHTGKLVAFMLDEVIGHSAGEQTPQNLLKVNKLNHILSFVHPTMEGLVAAEYVEPTTYGEAYRRVGIYDTHAADLEAKRIIDNRVYQVTPKGNTLVFLVQPSGEPKPKTQPEPGIFRLPGLLPKPTTG